MFKRAIRNGVLLCLVLSVCGSNAQNVAKNNSNLNPLYLDPSHPIEERVDDLMRRMTLRR